MSLEGVPNKKTFLSQKTAGSWPPYFLYPQLHSSFVRPPLRMTVYEDSRWKVLFRQGLSFEDHHGLQLRSVCQARKYDSEPQFLMTSCVNQHSFRTFCIHRSGWWHVKPNRCLVHVPNVNKLVIFLPSAFDYEAVEACDLLVKIFWQLLGNLRLLLKSKILPSKELRTPAVGSQQPLSAIQRPLPSPWWLPCCGWQCSHSAFALQSNGEACLLTQLTGTVSCSCCICSSTAFARLLSYCNCAIKTKVQHHKHQRSFKKNICSTDQKTQ